MANLWKMTSPTFTFWQLNSTSISLYTNKCFYSLIRMSKRQSNSFKSTSSLMSKHFWSPNKLIYNKKSNKIMLVYRRWPIKLTRFSCQKYKRKTKRLNKSQKIIILVSYEVKSTNLITLRLWVLYKSQIKFLCINNLV